MTDACRPPIFIGGTGRCGSTALARLVGSHPAILSLRWESQFIVSKGGLIDVVRSGYDAAAVDGFLSRLRSRWFRRTLNRGKANEYEAGLCHDISADQLEAAIARLQAAIAAGASGYRTAGDFVRALIEPAVIAADANRWCEKTPRNVLYIEHLWRMLPGMKFIHIIRDGRDVVASMLERGFWPIAATDEYPTTAPFHGEVTFETALDYWVEMVRLGRRKACLIPSTNYLEMRFEDLVASPERSMRTLFEFIDEPPNQGAHDLTLEDSHMGRWVIDLTSEQIELFHDRAGDALMAEGYSLSLPLATTEAARVS